MGTFTSKHELPDAVTEGNRDHPSNAHNGSKKGVDLKLDPWLFHPEDLKTKEMEQCIVYVKLLLNHPTVMQAISKALQTDETRIQEVLLSAPIVIRYTTNSMLKYINGHLDRSIVTNRVENIYLHILLISELRPQVLEANKVKYMRTVFFIVKTILHELVHFVYGKLNTDQSIEVISSERVINGMKLTDIGDIIEVLVFGGIIWSSADQLGTFTCDRLIKIISCSTLKTQAKGHDISSEQHGQVSVISAEAKPTVATRITGFVIETDFGNYFTALTDSSSPLESVQLLLPNGPSEITSADTFRDRSLYETMLSKGENRYPQRVAGFRPTANDVFHR